MGCMDRVMLMDGIRENRKASKLAQVGSVSKRISNSKGDALWKISKKFSIVTKSTKYCRKAIHYGILLAKQNDAQVYVLHLMHDPFGRTLATRSAIVEKHPG